MILFWEIYLHNKCSWIGYNSEIVEKPVFPHDIIGIFISGDAKIGKGAVIFQHVTIGSNTLPGSKSKGAPQIGDNVFIGAGAKIIGNVRIGNNCKVGAGTVVTIDLPDNSVAVMNHPRIILQDDVKQQKEQI